MMAAVRPKPKKLSLKKAVEIARLRLKKIELDNSDLKARLDDTEKGIENRTI